MTETLAEKKEKYDSYYGEIKSVIECQLHGAWDSLRARDYWRRRLPELDLSVLADVLTDVYSHTSSEYLKRYATV
ncbi:hypothetical protein [Serratia fonticola]|uniref:hypothetical protein n=1 Tax=Serratia fonticola TaxID=47917 RepID=UPI000E0FAEA1|nr:hypothetical protein [Serratia fonticola]RDL15923.1 hypothetical protein DFO62_12218 [Serratia fonticola]